MIGVVTNAAQAEHLVPVVDTTLASTIFYIGCDYCKQSIALGYALTLLREDYNEYTLGMGDWNIDGLAIEVLT